MTWITNRTKKGCQVSLLQMSPARMQWTSDRGTRDFKVKDRSGRKRKWLRPKMNYKSTSSQYYLNTCWTRPRFFMQGTPLLPMNDS